MSLITINDYVYIRWCYLEMAYDMGCVNSLESEKGILRKASKVLSFYSKDQLLIIESDLSLLSTSTLKKLCCGEDYEQNIICRSLSPLCDKLLNQLFEALLEN